MLRFAVLFTILLVHFSIQITSGQTYFTDNSKSKLVFDPMDDPVGDFYVHLVHGASDIEDGLTSSTKLLRGKITVIHFYDGGWGGCRPCAAKMESWARSIPEVQFLCVCVESREVAIAFHRMFQFKNVVNAYIPSRPYMPVGYGQLGCSGFIISNNGNFVSRKTKAYLQYGEHAFTHVESILATIIPDDLSLPSNDDEKKESTSISSVKIDSNQEIAAPPSVGVHSMDEEHKECTNYFNAAIRSPSVVTLQQLHAVLLSHFEHEEELMKQHMNSSRFSALDSHSMDHKRILNIATSELQRVNTCGLQQQWHKTPVDPAVIHKLAHEFHSHAKQFDSLYEGRVPTDAS